MCVVRFSEVLCRWVSMGWIDLSIPGMHTRQIKRTSGPSQTASAPPPSCVYVGGQIGMHWCEPIINLTRCPPSPDPNRLQSNPSESHSIRPPIMASPPLPRPR